MESDEYETTTFNEDIIYTTIAPKMYKEFLSVRQTIEIRKEFPDTWMFLTSEKYEEFCLNSLNYISHIISHRLTIVTQLPTILIGTKISF